MTFVTNLVKRGLHFTCGFGGSSMLLMAVDVLFSSTTLFKFQTVTMFMGASQHRLRHNTADIRTTQRTLGQHSGHYDNTADIRTTQRALGQHSGHYDNTAGIMTTQRTLGQHSGHWDNTADIRTTQRAL